MRKTPINAEMAKVGAAMDDAAKKKDPKYDPEDHFVSMGGESGDGHILTRLHSFMTEACPHHIYRPDPRFYTV